MDQIDVVKNNSNITDFSHDRHTHKHTHTHTNNHLCTHIHLHYYSFVKQLEKTIDIEIVSNIVNVHLYNHHNS